MAKRFRNGMQAVPLGDKLDIDAEMLNNATFITFLNRIINIRTTLIEWDGLPETIDSRFLEMTLFFFGTGVFFSDEDPEIGYLFTKYTPRYPIDIYNNPTGRYAMANNGFRRMLSNNDSVIIWDNFNRIPAYQMAASYAQRLTEVQRAIDLNTAAQKNPILLTTNDEREMTVRNILSKYNNNTVAILADKEFFADKSFNSLVSSVDLGVEYKGDKLEAYKEALWDECLCSVCGINSVFKKKERAITQELDNAQEEANAVRFSIITPRKEAAEQIYKMFGLKLVPKFRVNNIEEVRSLGAVHNNAAGVSGERVQAGS